jgi:hypothetical protein
VAQWLRQQGHDVEEARQQGPDPGDGALLRLAADQGRILLTIDTISERLFSLAVLNMPESFAFPMCRLPRAWR